MGSQNGEGEMTEPALFGFGLTGPLRKTARGALGKKFHLIPFSVLNARDGHWQARKKRWLEIGLQSELGRGGNLLTLSDGCEEYRRRAGEYAGDPKKLQIHGQKGAANKPGLMDYLDATREERKAAKKRAHRVSPGGSPRPACDYSNNERGDGAGRPMREHTKSLKDGLVYGLTMAPYEKQHKPDAARKRKHKAARARSVLTADQRPGRPDEIGAANTGTSIFDPVLCEVVYRWFSGPGAVVLDPFAGGSVRGIVAAALGRKYYGVDLSKPQVAANRDQARTILPRVWTADAGPWPKWRAGDSLDVLPSAPAADLVFTCPPYGNLEQYSDDPRDLSNMEYAAFIKAYFEIIKLACNRLRNNRFAAVVVGEYRGPSGNYVGFVPATVMAFKAAGLELYNEAVLLTAVGSLPVRTEKQFNVSRKLGKTHQQLLVFLKGDARKAAKFCIEGVNR